MTKEHKKLYKAGKNWVVATLATTTIALLGGMSAYTVHADTTTESNQIIHATSVNQTIQKGKSDNSVGLNYPVTTQNSGKIQSKQSIQSASVSQHTPNTVTTNTTTNSSNRFVTNNHGTANDSNNLLLTHKDANNSSLWYQPSTSGFEGDVERSGLGEVERKISDPVYPNVTVYYSFLHSWDKYEIQKYAHKTVTRSIYSKNPQTGVEGLDEYDQVNFNRWVAIDEKHNNRVVGLGPWVLSLDSSKSFSQYYIPQINGYTSYCNDKKTTVIGEERVSGNQLDEIYHITYVPNSSTVAKKTRTIVVHYPNREQPSTIIQNAELDGSGSDSWPEYIIPECDGYNSYVNGLKATSIPAQVVNANDDDIVINVTYQKITHKTITRTIRIHDINGSTFAISQTVSYIRYAISDAQGNIVSYTNWTAEGNGSWNEYTIPQHEGYKSQVNSNDAKIIPSQNVSPDDNSVFIDVTYKHESPTYSNHKTITRTIRIHDINGNILNTISQTVSYIRYAISDAQGNIVSYTNWTAEGNGSWNEYTIPQHEGYKSQVNSNDAKIIPSQNVSPDGKDVNISITYVKVGSDISNHNDSSLLDNEVPYDFTTLNNNENANYGHLDHYQLTENSQGQAQLVVSGWQATGSSNQNRYRYVIVYDDTLGREIARQKVAPVTRDDVQKVYPNVTNSLYSGFNTTIDIPNSAVLHTLRLISRYSSDPNSGEMDRIDYWYDPVAANMANNAYLDNLSSNGSTLTVSGWHATNKAANRPYHYIIAWDQRLGHEIARQEVTSVSRPDVAKTYPGIFNAINSGFKVGFTLTPEFFNDNIQFISRWTNDPNGNGSAVDYWFSALNRVNRACLDSVNLSSGRLQVAGWHATDLSQLEPNHYLIVFDNTTGQQVASEKVGLNDSVDVQRTFNDIHTANHSRFNYTFGSLNLIAGHNYSLVSRYSADANGNGNDGAHTDYWLNMGAFNQAAHNIDQCLVRGNELTVGGWMINDHAMSKPYAYVILLQNGHEIGRQRVLLSTRDDVARVYPRTYNSRLSGFNVHFTLPQYSLNGLQAVLRFTDDPAGNGNSADEWVGINPIRVY